MIELGIFVDESGDFDLKSKHSPYYIVTLVIHNKKDGIGDDVNDLERHISEKNLPKTPIHSAPIIRNELEYKNYTIEERRFLFFQMYNFTRKVPITYKTFIYEKKIFKEKDGIISQMGKDLSAFVDDNYELFSTCKELKVYYDNGQAEISRILYFGLNCILNNVEIKRVVPSNYRLLQVADFICTIELLRVKNDNNQLTKSEKGFLKIEELNKIVKTLNKKRI